jgi:hypothetical protein
VQHGRNMNVCTLRLVDIWERHFDGVILSRAGAGVLSEGPKVCEVRTAELNEQYCQSRQPSGKRSRKSHSVFANWELPLQYMHVM